MSNWTEGAALTPTNLNNNLASASSSTGFSTNTLRAESGNTISLLAPSSAFVAKSIDSGGMAWNALAYGAAGGTDSTSAIQAALNRAAANGGGTVDLPTGIYTISSALTVGRNVRLRGAGGGRDLNGTSPTQLYMPSAATTVLILGDVGGSGAIVEDLTLSASGNANNLGGILIQQMGFCEINRVGISGMSSFGIRIQGGNDANFNSLRGCVIATQSSGSCIDVQGLASGMDSSPLMVGCLINANAPWVSIDSAGKAPDHPFLIGNRFISSSSVTGIYGLMTNAYIQGNRFEVTAGSMTITLAPPTGSQPAGAFIANDYPATGGVVFNDSSSTPSGRWMEITASATHINMPVGTVDNPAYGFASEQSLGLYRSAASTIALSYGTLNLNNAILSSIRSTNASATSATLNDGEFRVAAVSTTSAELAYRSGNTTYRFIAAATAL